MADRPVGSRAAALPPHLAAVGRGPFAWLDGYGSTHTDTLTSGHGGQLTADVVPRGRHVARGRLTH